MHQKTHTVSANRLLRGLEKHDLALIEPHLHRRSVERGEKLFAKGERIEKVWFPESGLGSIVTTTPEGLRAESGLVGRDGFLPVSMMLGDDLSPHEGLMQLPGECLSIPAATLREALARSSSLQLAMLRFTKVLSVQTAYTALSNAVHQVDERLARWLLMCLDRVDDQELELTHDFLSIMLAVRRPTVSLALQKLEGMHLIRSDRGCIRVRDRAALEEFAGASYGAPEAEYERLIGPLR
jgi:CRP-like cAMP-binding protein